MKQSILKFGRRTLLLSALAVLLVGVIAPTLKVSAAVTNPTATAKVSFTFDDSLASTFTQAAPTLAKYGLAGTDYVITGCVGMTTAPNTCHANTDQTYLTWDQITALQNTYKWDIGSHTVSHPYLATFDATDGQPAALTNAQVTAELTNSKSALAAHGINATDFASPYGDYNTYTLQEIAKLYATHRGFADQNNNDYPYNELLLNDYQVQAGVTVAQVEAKINDAITNKRWLVLTMHDIEINPSTDPTDYQYSTANLDAIAAYVKAKQTAGQIQSINVNQGTVTSDSNLFANGNFSTGISSGWTTDNATVFQADAGNNGSYPEPTHAIKITAGPTNAHLFSPHVAVNTASTYMMKNFINTKTWRTGEVAYYVDEYNAAGNWISGQYLKAERSAFVEDLNFTYKPSSANVATAALQVIVTGNSGITGYIDNSQMFALTSNTVVTPTNLVTNGAFDSGISSGWTTDDATHITADSASNGSPNNIVNSIMLTSGTAQGHLFSPHVAVSSTKNYSLTSYLNLKAIASGEVAFYVDEYSASGAWISGQYKVGVHAVGAADVGFSYTPSSANVSTASLQVIMVANSGVTGYVDDIRWYQN